MLQLEINEAKQELRRLTEMPSREIAQTVRKVYWKTGTNWSWGENGGPLTSTVTFST